MVLMTVHLGSVLVTNQLDVHFFFSIFLFQFSTCFEHPCAHHQENQFINPLNPELNPICCLLALLGANHFLHVSRIKVKSLTLRLLMSYIYIYIYDISTLRVNIILPSTRGSPKWPLSLRFPHQNPEYLDNSLAEAVRKPALYRLLTFQVPSLMSLFRCFVTHYTLAFWIMMPTQRNTTISSDEEHVIFAHELRSALRLVVGFWEHLL